MHYDTIELLIPKNSNYDIVGSSYRTVGTPNDIDILVTMDNINIDKVSIRNFNVIRRGKERGTFSNGKYKVDIWLTTREDRPYALLELRRPKGSVIGLKRIAKSKGLLLNMHGLFKNGKRIHINSEDPSAIEEFVKSY